MNYADIPFLSVAELAGFIERKEITPVDAVGAYLKRIEDVNPKLNAFITVLKEQALQEAGSATSEIANGRYLGPLHGIPVGVKDQIHTRGIRTTDASKLREHFVPEIDATVVVNLKKAGAIVLGKQNRTPDIPARISPPLPEGNQSLVRE